MNARNEALWLQQHGFNPMPLLFRGKRPLLSQWKIRQTERLTWLELERLFRPLRNLAIITGQTQETPNVLVIDADSADAIAFLNAEAPATPMRCKTGNGEHRYFQLPQGLFLKNSVKVNGIAVDIRSQGAYVVCPPSVHPSGRKYEWIDGPVAAEKLPFFPPGLIREELKQEPRIQRWEKTTFRKVQQSPKALLLQPFIT